MNSDRNKGGMTVDALMQMGLVASTAIPVLAFAALGFLFIAMDRTTFIFVIVFCAIVVLLGVLIVNYIVQRKIKERVQTVAEACRDYVSGDRNARAMVAGDDDFAMLCSSINQLLENQSNAAGGASFGNAGGDAAALQAQIEKLLQEVSAVGDGDLRVQAEVTPDTLGVLADSFNYMIEELAKVVGRVQSTAVQVTNATRRILDRSGELAQASETQVGQISQTTEAVEALAIFIQTVARNAQLSVEVAQEALHNAAHGQQSVRQTIEGMMLIRENVQETSKKIKRLGERSNEIGEIVRIIEDIADQTNLLALNAAIQSAMAGEHGRGFAVVADEIRLLAERSTESTKRIATLVKSIQGDTYDAVVAMEDSTQEVVKGSQLADEAGRALNSIYSAVERQAQMIETIARSANDQTTVSEAVAVAMGRISEITRQTDAGTQEAAVSVSYLAELAEQLRASVSTFRLPDRVNDMGNSFPNMTSVTELPDSNGSQSFAPPMIGMGNDWGQALPPAANFSPSQERGNSGSLVALTSRQGGQFSFNNQQQDFATQASFSGPQQFGNQPFGSQPNLGSGPSAFPAQQQYSFQPDFGEMGGFESQQQDFGSSGFGNQPFGSSPNFGGQNQPNFGGQNQPNFGSQNQPNFGSQNQPNFGGQNQPNFGGQNQPNFGGQNQPNFADQNQPNFGGQNQPNFGSQNQPNFTDQNQPFYAGQPMPPAKTPNPAFLPPAQQQGSSMGVRQRWQNGQNQGQLSFNQDQMPFQNNG